MKDLLDLPLFIYFFKLFNLNYRSILTSLSKHFGQSIFLVSKKIKIKIPEFQMIQEKT